MDTIVRTSHRGFFSRLMNSVVGVLIGLVLIPVSVFLIGWNEFRTVHRARGLIEAEKDVVSLPNSDSLADAQSGKLVWTTGTAATEETLSDSDFAISGNVLRLRRSVEMFQWVEHEERKSRKKLGGGEETVTTYTYSKQWKNDRAHSESFQESQGHINPELRFSGHESNVSNATVGAFQLRPEQLHRIDNWQVVPLDDKVLEKVADPIKKQCLIQGAYVYVGTNTPNPDKPEIGDVRLQFNWVQPTQVSILGKQSNNKIESYKTSNGETIDSLMVGNNSATEMFDQLKSENTMYAMILRIVGWVLSIVGFSLLVSPLKTLADIVPLFGNLVGMATFAISFLLGSCLTLISISIAWIAVRPIYSIGLLALAAVGLYFVLRRKKTPATAELPMATLV